MQPAQETRDAVEAHAKRLEWERQQPLGPLIHLRQAHVMRGEGDGTTIYFGRHRGAGFIGFQLVGWSGWRSRPEWMPGGWEYFNPTLSVGRLFSDGAGYRSWSCEVIAPAKLVGFYRWKIKPSGRRYRRDHPQSEGAA